MKTETFNNINYSLTVGKSKGRIKRYKIEDKPQTGIIYYLQIYHTELNYNEHIQPLLKHCINSIPEYRKTTEIKMLVKLTSKPLRNGSYQIDYSVTFDCVNNIVDIKNMSINND